MTNNVAKYQDRRKNGLCVQCGAPAMPGKCMCSYCQKRHMVRSRQQRKERIQEGRCVRCGAVNEDPTHTLCLACREKMRGEVVRHYERKKEKADGKTEGTGAV